MWSSGTFTYWVSFQVNRSHQGTDQMPGPKRTSAPKVKQYRFNKSSGCPGPLIPLWFPSTPPLLNHVAGKPVPRAKPACVPGTPPSLAQNSQETLPCPRHGAGCLVLTSPWAHGEGMPICKHTDSFLCPFLLGILTPGAQPSIHSQAAEPIAILLTQEMSSFMSSVLKV